MWLASLLALAAADNRSCFWSASARFERFWSLADYELFTALPHLQGPLLYTQEDLGMRHLSFVVIASLARASYAERMERTYMKAAANRIYLVDALIPTLPEALQVVMNGGEGAGPTDAVAVSRLMIWMNQVKQMYSSGGLPADLRWLIILGDDVYVNMPRMYYFLAGHASKDEHPVIFAHVLSNTEVYDFDMPCLDSATVLSRSALELLSEHASCKTCPYTGSNAISLAYCALYTAIPLVHVPGFRCQADAMQAHALSSHWIATGGFSMFAPEEMRPALFEADFPSLRCEMPQGASSYQQVAERIRFCQVARSAAPSFTLRDGAELTEESFQAPSRLRRAPDLPAKISADAWYFLAPESTWLHRVVLERVLEELEALGLAVAAFGSLPEGRCWLLSGQAAQRLQQSGLGLSTKSLEALKVPVIPTVLFNRPEELPRSLVGTISAGAMSGTWAVVDVDDRLFEDLELKARDREFYSRLLQENFLDLSPEQCSEQSLREAQRWLSFLHDDDEHIKVVRGFQSGRREFRTLHAMFRSEASEALPGVLRDTVLVARRCD